MLKSSVIETPLGDLFATGDEEKLHSLSFNKVECPRGRTKTLESIREELEQYFRGELKTFETSLYMEGTSFQKSVWKELVQIPFGKTKSYEEIAHGIQNPKACRAVGTANGKNPFVIVVPCHRVIAKDRSLGGYSQGLKRKEWLLKHEMLWRRK